MNFCCCGRKMWSLRMLLLYAGYLCIQAPMIFSYLHFKQNVIRWYLRDILLPAVPLVVLSMVLIQVKKFVISTDRWQLFFNLAVITIVFYVISLLINRRLLNFLVARFRVLTRRQPMEQIKSQK